MAHIIKVPTISDDRGDLSFIEGEIGFDISRVYYIYNLAKERGGHRHKKTKQAMICLNGSCDVYTNNGHRSHTYNLRSPKEVLIIEPEDWHTMKKFYNNPILLVLASELYDKEDYIYESYGHSI